jgi:ArsR family transcriptional regulator
MCGDARMEQVYVDTAKMLRAMSDPKRLRIVDMLSCGELCGCKILEEFHITQPTLSHDMKVLSEAGIVKQKREGKNIYYSLNNEALAAMHQTLGRMFEDKPDCICHQKSCCD